MLITIEPYEPSKTATINALRLGHTNLEERRTSWPVKIDQSGKELVDGWLYSVFIHTNLRPRRKAPEEQFYRSKFEGWVRAYGHASLEYAFREVVRNAGFLYFQIQEHLAAPLFAGWKAEGISAGISVAPAFGTARQETMKDGTVVVRRASSLYGVDETLLQKFKRLLRKFSSLQGTFKAFKMTDEELFKAFVESTTMREMINAAGFELHLSDHFTFPETHKYHQQFINPRTGKMCEVWIEEEGIVVVTRNSVRCWQRDFGKLKTMLSSPSHADFSLHSQLAELDFQLGP